ncbi:olfactory receptor 1P1 [Alligator mississippiensis]|uniref:olfactory receptor 1P1 n=1 Tax=Alligator mississippiensis TaxID=8496 RepID=UPI002877D850|nr:olfactory receptor 1P1 [Alligator mississippiensis]
MAIIWLDTHLHTPMYYFLGQLSFLDICYSSVTVPKMLKDSLLEKKTISFEGCITQIYFFLSFGGTECVLLAAMAYDRDEGIWLQMAFTIRNKELRGSSCEEDAIVLEKTEDPALFRISNKRSSEFHLVKTNYRGYLIVYARNIYPWQNEVPILFLYGRSIFTKLCTMTLYRSLVRSLQLSEEGLFRLRKPWKCLNIDNWGKKNPLS